MHGTMIIMKADAPSPDVQSFDRPVTLQELRAAVGGDIELVEGFDSIAYAGTVMNCVVLCNEHGKLEQMPINHPATLAWGRALQRIGITLYDGGGVPKDWLVGDIAVLFGDREFMKDL